MRKVSPIFKAAAFAGAAVMMLAGCGSSNNASGGKTEELDKNAKTEITFAGWSLDTTPEFQTLADGFMKDNPNITVKIKQYSADDYDKQLTSDISGKSQPDVFPIKNLQKYYTYAAESGGLADLSDIAASYDGDKNIDVSSYKLEDGKYYAMPYRQDSWVLFYNKDMFDKAGVAAPDGTWTWDDYTKAAEELKEKLPAAGYDKNSVYPLYQHNWQSVVQGFAVAQTDGAYDDFFKGDYSYLKPYYERALKWQEEGLTIDWNTSNSTKVQYQAQFGTQKAAMLPMGTWFAATLVSQQKSGDADKFTWGMAPIPQNPDGATSDAPVTFADPTGLAVSANISGQKLAAAKEFVKWASGEKGSEALAKIATTPAYFSDSVADTYFGTEGMATDDLSKKAWTDHKTNPENPVGKGTDVIQDVLKTANSSIMTKTSSVDDALAKATQDVKDQGVVE